jgi:tetratricopeptide (TPR) repeat protein
MPRLAPAVARTGHPLALTALLLAGACGGAPTPPPPTKVAEAKHHLAEPPRQARDASGPFNTPSLDAPPPRSEPQLPPAELDAALSAAKAARAAGDTFEATNQLYRCANKVPKHTRCEGELGMILLDTPNHEKAARHYLEQAIADDDPSADAEFYRRLADALRRAPSWPSAAVALERMIARTPAPAAEDHALLATTLQGVPGREADAAAALHRAFELDPKKLDYLRDEALLLSQIAQRRAEALAVLTRYRDAIASSAPDQLPAIERQIGELKDLLDDRPKTAAPAPPAGSDKQRGPAAPAAKGRDG